MKKKEGGVSLRCPDGCKLCFRMKSAYTNAKGTDIKRRSHFAHISAERANACLFIQKYGSKGESPEHANTREMIAEMDVVFERMCSHPCCRAVFTWHPKKSHLLTSRMEVPFKVGGIRKFFADVVYYNANGDIEAVIEVKHTHAVDKDKRTWLVNQPFKFIEVSTNDNPSKRQFTVIDSDRVFYCDGDVCNKGVSILKKQEEEDRRRRQEEEEIAKFHEKAFLRRKQLAEWIVSDGERGGGLNINVDELTDNYHAVFRHTYKHIKHSLHYFPDLKFTNQIIDSLCAEFKILNDDRCLRLLIQEDKWEEIQEREDWRHVYTNEQNRRLKEWKNSSLNKWLIKMQPNLVCPTGKPKGIHILLVAFVYPHQINYITGFHNSGTSDEYRMKYIDIVKACLNEDMTGGRPFREVSRPRVRSISDAIEMLPPYHPDKNNHAEVVEVLLKFIKTQLC